MRRPSCFQEIALAKVCLGRDYTRAIAFPIGRSLKTDTRGKQVATSGP